MDVAVVGVPFNGAMLYSHATSEAFGRPGCGPTQMNPIRSPSISKIMSSRHPSIERVTPIVQLSAPPRGQRLHNRARTQRAQDHRVEKPDTELFDIAAAAVRCSPDQIAMVGDCLINDVAGAQRAGWFGTWLDRAGTRCPDQTVPDARIASLDELPAALDQLTRGGRGQTSSSAGG